MARFGQDLFNGGRFGRYDKVIPNLKKTIRGIPQGVMVHKQLGKRIIFQQCRGNGYYGSVLGVLYQQKKRYCVPSSINNAEGQPARNALAIAVSNWKTILTDSEKKEYNRRAMIKRHMSGYNLYIGEYIKANV